MLGRGELRCIGATTLDEFRKYIEKDPALERRFQQVLVQEPSVIDTISILRGLRERCAAPLDAAAAPLPPLTARTFVLHQSQSRDYLCCNDLERCCIDLPLLLLILFCFCGLWNVASSFMEELHLLSRSDTWQDLSQNPCMALCWSFHLLLLLSFWSVSSQSLHHRGTNVSAVR